MEEEGEEGEEEEVEDKGGKQHKQETLVKATEMLNLLAEELTGVMDSRAVMHQQWLDLDANLQRALEVLEKRLSKPEEFVMSDGEMCSPHLIETEYLKEWSFPEINITIITMSGRFNMKAHASWKVTFFSYRVSLVMPSTSKLDVVLMHAAHCT